MTTRAPTDHDRDIRVSVLREPTEIVTCGSRNDYSDPINTQSILQRSHNSGRRDRVRRDRDGGGAVPVCGCRALYLGLLAGLVAGVSWIIVLSTLNVSAQIALPSWVRGRGLAVYTTGIFGAMTVGSLIWGTVASLYGLPPSLFMAGTGTVLGLIRLRSHRLLEGTGPDLIPSIYLPQPTVADHIDGNRGSVLVTVEYRIDPTTRATVLAAIYRQGLALRRNGAYRWGIFKDTASPDRWIESFVVDSWLEYLRQQERVTEADRAVADVVRRCQHGGPPQIRHFIAP